MNLPKFLTTVTSFSKILTAVIFVILPFAGFYLGLKYEAQFTKYLEDRTSLDRYTIKPSPSKTQDTSTASPAPNGDRANWKTYIDKEGLFKISYPPSWSGNRSGGMLTLGENRIDISIIIWNDGGIQYAETLWKQIDCAPGNDPNSGCAPLYNKEEKKLSLNGYTVYFKIDGNGQMHAYIPDRSKNKTVEIYSVYLTDRKMFDQILSTFRFLN